MHTDKNRKIYPDPFASEEEKKSYAYGLKIGKLIGDEWFVGKGGKQGLYSERKAWINDMRALVRGEQDTKDYKDKVSGDKDTLSYMNMDWTPINIAGKFCNIVSNGIKDNMYRFNVRAIDRHTAIKRKNREDYLRKFIVGKDLVEQANKILGVDIMPQEGVPEDEEALQLHMEINERPKIEIAEETLVEYVKRTSRWSFIENQKNNDLVHLGIAATRVYIDKDEGVKVRYVDPEYLVHGYCNRNDFSDVNYYGEVDTITLAELQRESGYNDVAIHKVAKSAIKGGNYDYERDTLDDFLHEYVTVIRFAYKTSKRLVYKKSTKKGKIKITKRDEKYLPPEGRSDYGRIDSVYDTWYEGTYVLNTEYLYNYKESENIVRGEQNKAMPPFEVIATNIRKNKLHSFLSDIKSIVDQLQRVHLKIQQLTAEIRPDTTEINLDTLAELDDGADNKEVNWKTVLSLLKVKGVVFTKTIDAGHEGRSARPAAQSYASQQGSGLGNALNVWAHYYNLIREITGVNPVREGTQPHDSLVGVNEMALLASNTVTKHIVDASVDLNKRTCQVISGRIKQTFKSTKIKEIYQKVVGQYSVEALEVLKDRHLHEFGFITEMLPTQQEMNSFKEDLGLALKEGSIDVEVKIEAEAIAKTNVKMAQQYLRYQRKKRIAREREHQEHIATVQSQSNIEAARANKAMQLDVYAKEMQIDVAKEGKIAEIAIMKEAALMQLREPQKAKEFEQDVFLEQIRGGSKVNMEQFKENEKLKRQDRNNAQQSKMISQRKDGAPPIDFENEGRLPQLITN